MQMNQQVHFGINAHQTPCVQKMGGISFKASDRVFGSAMFGGTFKLIPHVGLPFGTPKDNSLKINSLSLNTWFSNRNVFQNGVNALENSF